MNELQEKGRACKAAAYELMNSKEAEKNTMLEAIADSIANAVPEILIANQKDITQANLNGKTAAFIDRLKLNEERIAQMIQGIHQVIQLPDPCDVVLKEWERGDLHFVKKSVPIGVIGIIYEARPNVSVDATVLCLKSGNVCFLRGSKDTIHSNVALVKAMKEGILKAGYNEHFVELLTDTSRSAAMAFMQLHEYLDLLIPRGGASLIRSTVENARVPIIETGTGNCHVYVDQAADMEKAIDIIINAKCQRVSVCNACESVLVHKAIAPVFLPKLISALKQEKVRIHGDSIVQEFDDTCIPLEVEDLTMEYLALEISISVVASLEAAIQHINQYGTHHSDVIVSEDKPALQQFLGQVDSAVVYANASSRFSDGEEFGFGAEIGISTQKIHARGPMGLAALTTYKYQVIGDGTVRK